MTKHKEECKNWDAGELVCEYMICEHMGYFIGDLSGGVIRCPCHEIEEIKS